MNSFLIKISFVFFFTSILFSCKPDLIKGKNLSSKDKLYIKKLGLLDEDEEIIFFATQGGLLGVKSSGNFYTKNRIASYWIDKNHPDRTSKDFAYFKDIDTIVCQPRYNAVTLSSYMIIKTKSGKNFSVYIDADSSQTWSFFNGVNEVWQRENK